MQRRKFLFLVTLAAAAAPGLGQAVAPAESRTNGTASVPNFSGVWAHTSITGFEPLASGPTSLVNLSRRGITSDNRQLVGDYKNPILKPEAAEIVKNNPHRIGFQTWRSSGESKTASHCARAACPRSRAAKAEQRYKKENEAHPQGTGQLLQAVA